MKRIINGQQTCRDCQHTKPLAAFNKRSQMKAGYDSLCRACIKRRYATWFASLDLARRAKHLSDRREASRRQRKRRYAAERAQRLADRDLARIRRQIRRC